MMDSDSYNVVCTGNLIEGFERVDVQNSLSDLFKLSPEKAAALLRSKRTLKKDLPQAQAQAYKNKLESIGVETVLEKVESGFSGLALEPMDEPGPQQTAASAFAASLALEPIEQAQSRQENISPDEAPPTMSVAGDFRKPREAETEIESDSVEEQADKLNLAAIGAAAVAALIGAFVWKFIAVAFDYEHSLVALGIGGAVGYAALAMGARGQRSGMLCGALALVSILGGKYMAVDSFLEQDMAMFTEELASEEYQGIMQEQATIAAYYVENVHSDEDLRMFMVDYGYSEQLSPDEVTATELDDFRAYVAPMLEGVAQGDFDVAGWMQENYAREMENISTWDVVTSSLGFIDLIFLFFGVGAAYKLASSGFEKD